MVRAIAVVRKELQEISHDKTMLGVLIIFPIFIMMFMGSSFNSMEIAGLPIGVVGPANTSFAQMLLEDLSNSSAFKLEQFGEEAEAMGAFRNGQVRAVIIVPENFEGELEGGNGSTIRIVVDNSDIVLEQSIVAAMGAVVQASSADITREYVTSAWGELQELNSSASALAEEVSASRAQMEQTKERLAEIGGDISSLDIEGLSGSIEGAELAVGRMRGIIGEQRARVAEIGEGNEGFFNETEGFLRNASGAVNESILVVGNAHAELVSQREGLEETVAALSAAIDALNALKGSGSGSCCDIADGAIDLNIMSLDALRGNTESQIAQADSEIAELGGLNATLHAMRENLGNYTLVVAGAREGGNGSAEMLGALDEAEETLDSMGALFGGAREDISELEALLEEVEDAMGEMEGTLDEALEQAGAVDELIASLQETVGKQTGKDPENIAIPLSVDAQNHYLRGSFVDFIMPQVIAVSLLLSCFLLSSMSLVREKTRKTIVRSLLVPGAVRSLVMGKVASVVLISFAQVLMVLVVAAVVFGVMFPYDLVMLAAGTAVSALVLSSIGMLVGFFSRNESSAIQGCLVLAIPMMFLGNIIFSPDLLPAYTQILQDVLPLSHVTNIFKIVLITNGNPVADMTALIAYFVVLAGLVWAVLWKRRDITAYS